jgi:hypothetical protein
MTVDSLLQLLQELKRAKKIIGSSKIIMLSDAEGNDAHYLDGYDLEGKNLVFVPVHGSVEEWE